MTALEILLIDDDDLVTSTLQRAFKLYGYRVLVARSGAEGLQLARRYRPDIFILDIMMPSMDGYEVCRRIRADPLLNNIPVLFLTAKSRDEDKIEGFRAGANDYVTKPFNLEEVVLRIKALLEVKPPELALDETDLLLRDGIELNCRTFEVTTENGKALLTNVQFDLLYHLMSHENQIFTSDQLLQDVWDYPRDSGNPRLVSSHIRKLREKIEPEPKKPIFIRTIPGHGYIFSGELIEDRQLRQLRNVLDKEFNSEELRSLCLDLDINYEAFLQGAEPISWELVNYMGKMGERLTLAKALLNLRPNLIETGALSSFNLDEMWFNHGSTEAIEIVAEAKLILVGDGNVGKTSLVKRLIYDSFDPGEETTQGVAITRGYVELPCLEDQNAQINIWDFGGQGNMHATHPYFFSTQAVYLLVLNVRESERVNRAEYWIQLIRAYGGNSPIIVVANKIDQFSAHLDRRSLIDKYPQISGFAETSCKTGDGLSGLKVEISSALCLLKDINVRISKSLVRLKQILEEMMDPKSAQIKDTLSLDEYDAICERCDVSPEKRLGYLRRLTDLGVTLYYGDEPRLELNVVLNPFWVTEGVYTIINHESLAAANGKFTIHQLRRVLPRSRYPMDKAIYILDMMRKFELCFVLDEQQRHYLLPDLLPTQQPELPSFNREDALKFHFEYSVWQGMTLTRLIVRLNNHLVEDFYWRNGALLQSFDKKNRALVIADEVDNRLRIWIDGKLDTRRNFLNRIREELNVIHGIQNNRVVKEWVITPEGGQVSYSFLVNLEEKGRETCDIEIQNGIITLKIKELLDGVRAEEIPDLYRLKELIVQRLSLDELDDLCFRFHISLEDIEGQLTLDSKARNLVRQFERTRRMPELMSVLRDLRKDVLWK